MIKMVVYLHFGEPLNMVLFYSSKNSIIFVEENCLFGNVSLLS